LYALFPVPILSDCTQPTQPEEEPFAFHVDTLGRSGTMHADEQLGYVRTNLTIAMWRTDTCRSSRRLSSGRLIVV
jgi:hypothetical protein